MVTKRHVFIFALLSASLSYGGTYQETVQFMGCNWEQPKGFFQRDGSPVTWINLEGETGLQTISFEEEKFDTSLFQFSLIRDVNESAYGEFSIYSYRYLNEEGKELGYGGSDYQLITVSLGDNHITLYNVDPEIVKKFVSVCIPADLIP